MPSPGSMSKAARVGGAAAPEASGADHVSERRRGRSLSRISPAMSTMPLPSVRRCSQCEPTSQSDTLLRPQYSPLAPESVIAYTRTLPEAVVDRVREAADAVSARDWDRAEELTSGNRLNWEETDDFMTTYGQPPYTPLPDGFETDMHAAPIHGGGNWIDCLLWTETERPGDVEISLKITPAPDDPDHLNTAIVRMRAIGFCYPGRFDQRPRPQGPAWTVL